MATFEAGQRVEVVQGTRHPRLRKHMMGTILDTYDKKLPGAGARLVEMVEYRPDGSGSRLRVEARRFRAIVGKPLIDVLTEED